MKICTVLTVLALIGFMGSGSSVVAQEESDSGEVALVPADGSAESDSDDAGEHADGQHDEADHDAGEHDNADQATAEHAGDSHGGGHGEDTPLLGFDVGSAIVNVLIFLFVFAVLSAFVWPNVLGGLKAREAKIRSDLEAAEQANAKANSLLQEYQVKLDDAAQQVQTMLADARRDAESSGRRIVDEAKQEAARQQERAVADIQTAKKVAMSEIAGQTSDLAMKLAGSVVGRELREDDHSDLIRKSLDSLPSNN